MKKDNKYNFHKVGKEGRCYKPVEPMDYKQIRRAADSYASRHKLFHNVKRVITGEGWLAYEVWVYFLQDVSEYKD